MSDRAAEHPPAGIVAEICFGQRLRQPGLCSGPDGKAEMRRKLRQAGHINVAEPARPGRGETRIECMDVFDAYGLPCAVDESQIVSLTSVAQFLDR